MNERSSPVRRLVVVVGGWLAGWAIVLLNPDGVLGGDVRVYHSRVLAIEAGGIPYLEPVVEHLPGALVPMWAARILSGWGSSLFFAVVFTVLMACCLLGSIAALERMAGARIANRFLWLSAPLIPLVVFRNDPWVTLLAVVALGSSRRAVAAGVIAVLAKGWPIVLAVRELALGRRRRAVMYGIAGAAALAALLSPGLTAVQDAVGLHSETIIGAAVGLFQAIAGSGPEVQLTTAAYVEVPSWTFAVGPVLGVTTAAVGTIALRRDPDAIVPIALLVIGVIFSSRLFSTQYVLWLMPFLAFSASPVVRRLSGVIGWLSLVMVLTWNSLFEHAWWWMLTVGRNGLLVVLAIVIARNALSGPRVLVSPSP